MEFIFGLIAILFFIPAIVVFTDLISFMLRGKNFVHIYLFRVSELISMVFMPLIYIMMISTENNCCGDTAAFAPSHILTIVVLILMYLTAYTYSAYRESITTPVVEVLVNTSLILGVILNIFIAIQTDSFFLAGIGNFPIIGFLILTLVNNHKLFREEYHENALVPQSKAGTFAWKILLLKPLAKYPVLLLLCIPLTTFVICFLLLFGQKPDSIIRAFTETYKHGFSQLDHECDKVICGGHYLCTVAANGHHTIVKPERLGVRNGGTIICNRQLLVSNAFEELLQEKMPLTHRFIRRQYNKVGNSIRRHYHIFDNKMVSNAIYIIMKPAEWFFVIVLYTFDKHPENRIARQYISKEDRNAINNALR